MNNFKSRFNIKSFQDIEEENIKWLWKPYFPLGLISIIGGDPGVGKSFQSIYLASILSNGGKYAFSDDTVESSNVIIQNCEDLKGATIKKRLMAHNADCSKVSIIELQSVDDKKGDLLLKDVKELESIFDYYKPKLVIFDPITNFLGVTNMNDAGQVRTLLSPIGKLADKYNCAIIFIIHRNKGTNNSNPLHRIMGSTDFGGIARSVVSIGKNPNDTNEVLFMHTKSNLANLGETLAFKINDDGVIEWLGKRGHINDTEISDDDNPYKYPRERAMEFIVSYLTENGSTKNEIIIKNGDLQRLTEKTLLRARKELQEDNIIYKFNVGKEVYWDICPNAHSENVGE